MTDIMDIAAVESKSILEWSKLWLIRKGGQDKSFMEFDHIS